MTRDAIARDLRTLRGEPSPRDTAESRNGDNIDASVFEGSPMDPSAVPAEPLPALPGYPFLHAGAGALIVGPTGGGRSSLLEACAYDAARQGTGTAYLGAEVSQEEFNARAADLARRRGDVVTDELRRQLSHVRYLDLAAAIAAAWENPEAWVAEMVARVEVVAVDPVSGVASALGFDFDKSNTEFVRFYDKLIQPLLAAGLAVVSPDNVGHAVEAKSRAKGASAKQDKADLTFSCKVKTGPAGLIITAGKVRSTRAPFKRGDAWVFDRATQRVTAERGEDAWKPTVLMERVSRTIEETPGLTSRAVRDATTGKNETKAVALELLITHGYVTTRSEGKATHHYSKRPYRADEQPAWSPVPEWSPNGSHPNGDRGPLVPHLRDQGPGTTPLATPEQEALISRMETR